MVCPAVIDGCDHVLADSLESEADGSSTGSHDVHHAARILRDVLHFCLWFGVVLVDEQYLVHRATVVDQQDHRRRTC